MKSALSPVTGIPGSRARVSPDEPLRRWLAAGLAGVLLALVPFVALPARGELYALVVGINAYSGDNRLSSCVQDAMGIKDLLIAGYGASDKQVRLLLDQDATADGIRAAFKEHLVDKARAGDQVFFFFSGHGTVRNEIRINDRALKALVPCDVPSVEFVSVDRVITQEELKRWLGQMQTTNITVVLDCCFAGTLSRSAGGPLASRDFKPKFMDIGFAAAGKHLGEADADENRIYSKSFGQLVDVLWLGACTSNQVSYCGRPYSAFTGVLLSELKQAPQQAVSAFFPRVKSQVETKTRTLAAQAQTPVSEGPQERPLLFGSKALATSDSPTPAPAQPASTPPAPATAPSAPVAATPVPATNAAPAVSPPSAAANVVVAPVSPNLPALPQPFGLIVKTDKTRYVAGDTMRVTVVAEADCYLRLYVVNAAAEVQQLFPNQYCATNVVAKGTLVTIPAPDSFALRLGAPFGIETVVAVASKTQFADLFRPSFSGGFMDTSGMRPAEVLSRGITVDGPAARPAPQAATNQVSYAAVEYVVKEK